MYEYHWCSTTWNANTTTSTLVHSRYIYCTSMIFIYQCNSTQILPIPGGDVFREKNTKKGTPCTRSISGSCTAGTASTRINSMNCGYFRTRSISGFVTVDTAYTYQIFGVLYCGYCKHWQYFVRGYCEYSQFRNTLNVPNILGV